MAVATTRFSGRAVSAREMALVREIVRDCSGLSPMELARTVCELLWWRRPNGRLKARECREFLERLDADGALVLPDKRRGRAAGSVTRVPRTAAGEPGRPLGGTVRDVGPLEVELVCEPAERLLFRELVGRYHYLGWRAHAVATPRRSRVVASGAGRPASSVSARRQRSRSVGSVRPESCGGLWTGHSTGRWAWTPPPPVRRDSGGGVAPVVVPRLRDRSTLRAGAHDRRRKVAAFTVAEFRGTCGCAACMPARPASAAVTLSSSLRVALRRPTPPLRVSRGPARAREFSSRAILAPADSADPASVPGSAARDMRPGRTPSEPGRFAARVQRTVLMEQTALALVRGALVRWTRGSGYAVVQAISDQRIVVRWDEERHDHPTTFTAKDPPLVRVDVKNGHVCRRRSTDEIVVPQETVAPDPPVWRCLLLGDDSPYLVNIEEADLRPIPITNPIDRVAAGKIGSLARYRLREVTRWYRTQHFHDDLVSLGETGVDLKPHQVSVVHRVVANYPHRFLLCDEVGLGKTIEAGTVVKELRARRVVQRVLAIVPPNLVRQWQFEMKTKFNEVFAILNTATVGYLQDQGKVGNPFLHFACVLCSSRWVESPKWAKLCAAVDWDLVIVDEAHHARHQLFGKKAKSTRLYRLVQALSPPEQVMRRGMLFLTATPLQLHTHELYSLIELLDPALFPSEEHFDRHRASLPGLGRLVEHLSSEEFPVPDEDPEMTALKIAAWLDPQDPDRKCELVEVVAETIADAGLDVDGAIQRIHEFSPGMSSELQSLRESASRLRQRLSAKGSELQRIAMELSDRHLLSEILIRNRKATVGGFMPRSAHRWEVGLSVAERRGLEAVEEYVQHGFQLADSAGNRAVGFVMVIFQKLMASSIAAVREALRRRRLKVQGDDTYGPSAADLENRLDDDRDTGDIVGVPAVAANGSDELRLLDRAIDILKLVTVDSKAQVLVERTRPALS